MFSDFRGRQFADSCELVYRGFRYPQKPGHIHDRQDVAVSREGRIPIERCCFGSGIIHGNCIIGITADILKCREAILVLIT